MGADETRYLEYSNDIFKSILRKFRFRSIDGIMFLKSF